jgi:hypothetical protein
VRGVVVHDEVHGEPSGDVGIDFPQKAYIPLVTGDAGTDRSPADLQDKRSTAESDVAGALANRRPARRRETVSFDTLGSSTDGALRRNAQVNTYASYLCDTTLHASLRNVRTCENTISLGILRKE